MATPNFEQIQSFNNVKSQLQEAAIDELMGEIYEGMTRDELIEEAVRIADKFSMLGAELGAQWYDLCSELAGIQAEAAELHTPDEESLKERAEATIKESSADTAKSQFNTYLSNVINDSIRITGSENLWRDYERGLAGGRWARVPVGDTCAWCLMLASQGAWYLSKESALREEAGHYHNGCDCVAVYHADPLDINGYESKLNRYKTMYYTADDIRMANSSGKKKYPDELAERVKRAREEHEAKYEAGETEKKWTVYNEDMIVMRYKYGLK